MKDFNPNNYFNPINSTYTYPELLFTDKSQYGWFFSLAFPTGWLLIIILIVMQLLSLPFIRKNGLFELFHYSHMLYAGFYLVMIVHSAQFWRWFILPGLLLLFDRLYTLYNVRSSKLGDTLIKDVILLSSNVTNLIITRPEKFNFNSGDYIYVNIPTISKTEWHPFTVSSAPEDSTKLTLHIRSLGNWTQKLYDHFYVFARKDPIKHLRSLKTAERRFRVVESGIFLFRFELNYLKFKIIVY